MNISPADWNTLSKLLDQALDLDPDTRTQWLERIDAREPELAPALRKLLAAHATHETEDLLARALAPPAVVDATTDDAALAPGDLVGPYRLVRELGSGGMADVWLAERADGAFSREVALKLPLVNRLRRDLAVRFMRERNILARLEHPGIARFYDAGVTADGVAYMAMEFVDGEPLLRWCDNRRLDIPARLRLFQQVQDAVQYAHANLVIHRDLKPSNILVTADGHAHLLDFGIAKLLAEEGAQETQLTRLVGRPLTPDYASPEQIKGEPLTIATDIYSLGVLLYELLAGQRPYRLKLQSVAQVEQAIVATDPPRPSTMVAPDAAQSRGVTASRLARLLAGDLDTIVQKALAKAPAQRYLTVGEFAADLAHYLAGEPVQARPASWGYRARKFVVRNRVAVSSAAAIGVALVAATAVSAWQAQRAREEAARAEAVKAFVVSFFEAGEWSHGAKRKTTAADMLIQAQERLDAAQISSDLTRWELLETIGGGLRNFDEARRAADTFAKAVRLAEATFGSEDPKTAIAHATYGMALVDAGEFDRAEAELDIAEKDCRRNGQMKWLAVVLRNRANLMNGLGQYDRAVELAREAVAVIERAPPPQDRGDLMAAYRDYAVKLLFLHRKGGLDPARHAYDLAREQDGNRPTPMVLEARRVYALALAEEGDPQAALAEMKAVLPQMIEANGPDAPELGSMWRAVGAVAMSAGDPRTAIDSFKESVRIAQTSAAGKPTRALAVALANLGSACTNGHYWPEALDAWRASESAYTALSGPDHPASRFARSGVALALAKLGRIDESAALFTALLARPASNANEESFLKSRTAQLRIAQGRYADAQTLLREEVARYPQGSNVRLRALALAEYGDALLAGSNAAEALPALQEARDLLAKAQPKGSPDLADIARDIARARIALGQADQAVAPAEEAEAWWRGVDPAHHDHGVALAWYARALAANGNAAKAAGVAQQATQALATAGLPGDRAVLAMTKAIVATVQR